MGIRLDNDDDMVLTLRQAGSLTTGANVDAVMVPFDYSLIGVMAFVGAQGTGTSAVVDVLKNESSIYGATKIVFPASTSEATYQTPTNDVVTGTRGDVYTLKVTTAFGTTQSKDLVVSLLFRKLRASAPAASYQGPWNQGGVGEE